MSKIWIIMLIASIGTLLFIDPNMALSSMLKGANASIQLAITLTALYGFWLGFFAVLEKLRITDVIAKLLKPLIRFLFKGSSDEAVKYISMNMAANLIGLGNAATPMGIKALELLEGEDKKANTNMIMLIVISATSLQLLPSTVIGLRAEHGSINPTDFLLPCILATVISTIVGIIMVKVLSKLLPDKKKKKTSKKELMPDLTMQTR